MAQRVQTERARKMAERRAERAASAERIARAQAETRAIVFSGKCPNCASALKRNLALTGWYQCAQFGAEQFRADASKPACNWQGFVS